MNNFPSSGRPCRSESARNPASAPPNLTLLTVLLQQALDTLQEHRADDYPNRAMPPTNTSIPADNPDDADCTADCEEEADDSGETRCYYFSEFTLKNERALLKKYKVNDLQALLCEAHASICGLAELMKKIPMETHLSGDAVQSLGCLLDRVSSMLSRIQDAYSTVEEVES